MVSATWRHLHISCWGIQNWFHSDQASWCWQLGETDWSVGGSTFPTYRCTSCRHDDQSELQVLSSFTVPASSLFQTGSKNLRGEFRQDTIKWRQCANGISHALRTTVGIDPLDDIYEVLTQGTTFNHAISKGLLTLIFTWLPNGCISRLHWNAHNPGVSQRSNTWRFVRSQRKLNLPMSNMNPSNSFMSSPSIHCPKQRPKRIHVKGADDKFLAPMEETARMSITLPLIQMVLHRDFLPYRHLVYHLMWMSLNVRSLPSFRPGFRTAAVLFPFFQFCDATPRPGHPPSLLRPTSSHSGTNHHQTNHTIASFPASPSSFLSSLDFEEIHARLHGPEMFEKRISCICLHSLLLVDYCRVSKSCCCFLFEQFGFLCCPCS